jgi:hypothetical protein
MHYNFVILQIGGIDADVSPWNRQIPREAVPAWRQKQFQKEVLAAQTHAGV